MAIDAKNIDSLFGKASVYEAQGSYTDAIKSYDKALAIDANYKEALNGKGNALDSLGNHTQAILLL